MHPSSYIVLVLDTVVRSRYYGVSSAPNAFASVLLEEEKTSEIQSNIWKRARRSRSDVACHHVANKNAYLWCVPSCYPTNLAARIVKAFDGRRHRP
jgi:hypothetical protein